MARGDNETDDLMGDDAMDEGAGLEAAGGDEEMMGAEEGAGVSRGSRGGGGRTSSRGGRASSAKRGGSRSAGGSRKAAGGGARKSAGGAPKAAGGSRKSSGTRTTGGRKSAGGSRKSTAGGRKTSGGRKSAGGSRKTSGGGARKSSGGGGAKVVQPRRLARRQEALSARRVRDGVARLRLRLHYIRAQRNLYGFLIDPALQGFVDATCGLPVASVQPDGVPGADGAGSCGSGRRSASANCAAAAVAWRAIIAGSGRSAAW